MSGILGSPTISGYETALLKSVGLWPLTLPPQEKPNKFSLILQNKYHM